MDSTTEGYLFKLLKNVDVTKAAGIEQISRKFLKDGVQILAKTISELCNLSMKTFSRCLQNRKGKATI